MKTQIFTLLFILTLFYSGSTQARSLSNEQGLKTDTQTISIYPNPINEKGTIKFNLEAPSDLKIEFFDLSGKKVSELKKNNVEAGEHKIEFKASELKEGVYLCKISTNAWEKAKRMIIKH